MNLAHKVVSCSSSQWRADVVIPFWETLQLVGGMWWNITSRMENTCDKVIISTMADGPQLWRRLISCVWQNIFHLLHSRRPLCLYKKLPLIISVTIQAMSSSLQLIVCSYNWCGTWTLIEINACLCKIRLYKLSLVFDELKCVFKKSANSKRIFIMCQCNWQVKWQQVKVSLLGISD